jgi:hypothetical protein
MTSVAVDASVVGVVVMGGMVVGVVVMGIAVVGLVFVDVVVVVEPLRPSARVRSSVAVRVLRFLHFARCLASVFDFDVFAQCPTRFFAAQATLPESPTADVAAIPRIAAITRIKAPPLNTTGTALRSQLATESLARFAIRSQD